MFVPTIDPAASWTIEDEGDNEQPMEPSIIEEKIMNAATHDLHQRADAAFAALPLWIKFVCLFAVAMGQKLAKEKGE